MLSESYLLDEWVIDPTTSTPNGDRPSLYLTKLECFGG